jgi:flagellar motility protein MotE (MotC chaperone)
MLAAVRTRLRLLPTLVAVLLATFAVRAEALWRAATAQPASGAVGGAAPGPAAARTALPAPRPAAASPPTVLPSPPAAASAPLGAVAAQVATANLGARTPEPAAAERALLERLRERRAELEARERAAEAREAVLAAAEQRLAQRIEELARLQERLEALERNRAEREDSGWRGLVRLYESMRPREAAAIFDELEMPVLVQILDRMREAKAAPVIGAMRPERARQATMELARHRGERSLRPDGEGGGE